MVLQPARLPLQLERMIKDRPHRLGLIYVNQPLYFVTFATRDRKRFPSLHRAQLALEQYGIMPDHVHLFVRGDRRFTLSSWIGGLKRAILAALLKEAQPARLPLQERSLWQPGFFDHILRSDESYAEKWNYVRDNPVRAGLVKTADEWQYQGEIVVIDRA